MHFLCKLRAHKTLTIYTPFGLEASALSTLAVGGLPAGFRKRPYPSNTCRPTPQGVTVILQVIAIAMRREEDVSRKIACFLCLIPAYRQPPRTTSKTHPNAVTTTSTTTCCSKGCNTAHSRRLLSMRVTDATIDPTRSPSDGDSFTIQTANSLETNGFTNRKEPEERSYTKVRGSVE